MNIKKIVNCILFFCLAASLFAQAPTLIEKDGKTFIKSDSGELVEVRVVKQRPDDAQLRRPARQGKFGTPHRASWAQKDEIIIETIASTETSKTALASEVVKIPDCELIARYYEDGKLIDTLKFSLKDGEKNSKEFNEAGTFIEVYAVQISSAEGKLAASLKLNVLCTAVREADSKRILLSEFNGALNLKEGESLSFSGERLRDADMQKWSVEFSLITKK